MNLGGFGWMKHDAFYRFITVETATAEALLPSCHYDCISEYWLQTKLCEHCGDSGSIFTAHTMFVSSCILVPHLSDLLHSHTPSIVLGEFLIDRADTTCWIGRHILMKSDTFFW